MPIFGTPTSAPAPGSGVACSTLDVVSVEETVIDEQLLLTKSQTHEVQAGTAVTLEFTILDADGLPVDLTGCMRDYALNSGDSVGSGLDTPVGSPLMVRFREAMANSTNIPLYEVTGEIHDSAAGIVRVVVPTQVMALSGIYNVNWGVFQGVTPIYVVGSYLFVTRSLFGANVLSGLGPPGLRTLRLALRDSSAYENQLLQRLEFDDSDLAAAVIRPVREFNESPPNLRTNYDTTNFPYQEAWLWGIQGYLAETAAWTYRRNTLAYNAGGLSVDDLNKEQSYLQLANYNLERWRDFMLNTKVALNAQMCYGTVGSIYGDIGIGW